VAVDSALSAVIPVKELRSLLIEFARPAAVDWAFVEAFPNSRGLPGTSSFVGVDGVSVGCRSAWTGAFIMYAAARLWVSRVCSVGACSFAIALTKALAWEWSGSALKNVSAGRVIRWSP
jgi:hypothetical protein